MGQINETVLMLALNDKTFGRNEAADIVGGLARLKRLIEQGEIRVVKKSTKQNAKWFCNAWDVIKHAYSPWIGNSK